ncbi:MAG: hypothetical protein ACFB0C_13920 [Leptolyngbyaceae cyanobacterium]
MTRHRWIWSTVLLGLWALPLPPVQAETAESEPEAQQIEEYPCLCRCPCGCTYPDYGPQPITAAEVEFPLPGTVHCMLQIPTPGQGSINFQTELSLEEAIAFYRDSFATVGVTEREINTSITESVFSMVFDGWPEAAPGEAVVVQGVDLGGRVNINIRIEDLGQ